MTHNEGTLDISSLSFESICLPSNIITAFTRVLNILRSRSFSTMNLKKKTRSELGSVLLHCIRAENKSPFCKAFARDLSYPTDVTNLKALNKRTLYLKSQRKSEKAAIS